MNSYSQYITFLRHETMRLFHAYVCTKKPYFYRGNSGAVFPFIYTSTKAINEMITSMIGTRTR